MPYTVKKLAKMSGVSIRTLRFYDEIGLLKPAYYGNNNYRYYEEEQLLKLQQILFYRQLGFSLTDIQRIVNSNDFDKVKSLISHRNALEKNLEQSHALIKTIDKTISHLRGETLMHNEELFVGFELEKQQEYKTYLINLLGDKVKSTIESTEAKMKSWKKDDWDRFHREWGLICADLAKLLEKNLKADSPEVQKVIKKHYEWLPWSGADCTREAYIGLGQGYTGLEWKKAFSQYDSNHPRLAKFMSEAMKIFAEKNLS